MARLQQSKQAAVTTGKAGATGIPCAMVYGLSRALLGVPGFIATVAFGLVTQELDPSVGRSGPHAFAVREAAFVGAHQRAAHPHVHRTLPPTSVTIASRPSRGSRMRGEKHVFRKNGSGIFLREGLDRGDRVEMAKENFGFGAAEFGQRSIAVRYAEPGVTCLTHTRSRRLAAAGFRPPPRRPKRP